MNRRDVLKLLAAAPLSMGATQLLAAPASEQRILLVFMRGGYDCASLLVPYDSSFYYDSRPNIAIARPDPSAGAVNAALALDSHWALNPALKDSIFPLYQKGQVAFVPFAGTDDLTRSHFETQDSIELGQTVGQSRNYRSGFLNRLVAVLGASQQSVEAIAFTDQLPIVFQGTSQIPNMALKSVGKPGVDDREGQIIAAMYRNTALAKPVSEGFDVRSDVMKMNAEMDQASRNAITAKGFEGEARRIARMMRERYNVGFVDIGGWDTHVGQGAANGYLSGRLGELGRGLAAYADEMGPAWDHTTVVVVSEFGRTFRENGNRGTDHGHGSVYWVLGGSVRGGRIAGEQVAISQATLFQNRDYPVLNDYRGVLAGLLGRLYQLNAKQSDQVFPGANSQDLQLV